MLRSTVPSSSSAQTHLHPRLSNASSGRCPRQPDRIPERLAVARLIHRLGLAIIQERLAVHHDGDDVLLRTALDERLDRVADGAVVQARLIDDQQVSFGAWREPAKVFAAKKLRASK